jgi:hypothetical protein
MRKILFLWAAFSFVALQVRAQNASISVSRDRILLGEQFELKLQAEAGLNEKPIVFPRIPDSVNSLEVIRRGGIDSARVGDKFVYSQVMTMTGFDSGAWVIPAQTLLAGGKKLRTDSLRITVMPVKLKDSTYHDIRDIVSVPDTEINWKRILLMALGLGLIGALAWYWWKNRGKKPLAAPVNRSAAYEEAISALEKIRKDALHEKGDMKGYYSAVYDVYRTYLGRITGKPLMQGTTEDLVLATHEWQLPDSFASTVEVLRITDAVKFAKYASSGQEAMGSWQRIRAAVDEVNQKTGRK